MITRNLRFITGSTRLISRSFNTDLSDELKSMRDLCKKFATDELKPVAGVLDKEGKFPKKQIQWLGELGMMGIGVSSEYGGANLNTLALSVAVEELSRGCGSTGSIVSIHNCLYASLLERVGTHEQKMKYLKPFTNGNKIGAFALSESGLYFKFIESQLEIQIL